jgi:hypothetical protein
MLDKLYERLGRGLGQWFSNEDPISGLEARLRMVVMEQGRIGA